ncbi:MAG: UDP-N-acetylmuramate dehydrogenase [Lachnospiraceae bacterium]|nr:UDP-N-acetylmuramate dehydrogenase [Lachnospiraceae bacterium]
MLSPERVLVNEPLYKHTTFRIGGPAKFYVYVDNTDKLKRTLDLLNNEKVKYVILGNGSNVLASDEGYDGVIIKLGGEFREFTYNDDLNDGTCNVRAGGGMVLSKLSFWVCKKGFAGLEFAGGIPGTVGGAVFMNAGAYGNEIKDILVSAEVLTKEGEVRTLTADELKLSYRHSAVMDSGDIVLFANFKFKIETKIEIFAIRESYRQMRNEKQPLDLPSAGSTFKRPEGNFAGKLIQECGLKGAHVGDACVSEKHAGFIVNKGNAKAKDVCELIKLVQDTVFEKTEVKLEPEIRFLF